MIYTIKKGTAAKLLLVFAHDGQGVGVTGLRHDTPGASAAYVREGDSVARSVELRHGAVGRHDRGGFVEVDRALVPGVYQFGAPSEMLVDGADAAVLVLRFPGAVIEPVYVGLVAFDPQDEVRLGMSAIGPEGRIAALRGAFPRLAARELDEVMARREAQ